MDLFSDAGLAAACALACLVAVEIDVASTVDLTVACMARLERGRDTRPTAA
jgi:hypothetical protein